MGRRLYSYICYGVDLAGYDFDEAYSSLCQKHSVNWRDNVFKEMGYEGVTLMEYSLDGHNCMILSTRRIEHSEFDRKAIPFDPVTLVVTKEDGEILQDICNSLGIEDIEPQWYLCGSFI